MLGFTSQCQFAFDYWSNRLLLDTPRPSTPRAEVAGYSYSYKVGGSSVAPLFKVLPPTGRGRAWSPDATRAREQQVLHAGKQYGVAIADAGALPSVFASMQGVVLEALPLGHAPPRSLPASYIIARGTVLTVEAAAQFMACEAPYEELRSNYVLLDVVVHTTLTQHTRYKLNGKGPPLLDSQTVENVLTDKGRWRVGAEELPAFLRRHGVGVEAVPRVQAAAASVIGELFATLQAGPSAAFEEARFVLREVTAAVVHAACTSEAAVDTEPEEPSGGEELELPAAGDDEASASTTVDVGVRRRADMACGSKQKMRISGHGEDEFEFVVPSGVLVGKVFYVVVPAPAEPRLAGFVEDSDEEDDEDNENMAGPAPGDDLARGEASTSSDEDEEKEQDERGDWVRAVCALPAGAVAPSSQHSRARAWAARP